MRKLAFLGVAGWMLLIFPMPALAEESCPVGIGYGKAETAYARTHSLSDFTAAYMRDLKAQYLEAVLSAIPRKLPWTSGEIVRGRLFSGCRITAVLVWDPHVPDGPAFIATRIVKSEEERGAQVQRSIAVFWMEAARVGR